MRKVPIRIFAALAGTAVFLAIVWITHFSDRAARIFFWLPGKASYFIDRVVLGSPGVHGLGQYNPGLLFTIFYAQAVILSLVVAWTLAKTLIRR
jgi:hypothetical protein